MVALQAASTDGNGQVPAAIDSGMPESFSVISVMTPSVPSEPTKSRVEIVTGGGFFRAPRGRNQLAVCQHRLQRQHIVLHRAVTHGVGAGRARRCHAADRRIGAGIDRKKQTLVAQIFIELLARYARLNDAIEIFGMYREHAVHVLHVDANAAARRIDLAFERGAGAERNDRHIMLRADAHDLLHVFGRLREYHGVRRLVGVPRRGVAVLFAHGLRGDDTISERCGERRYRGFDPLGVGLLFGSGVRETGMLLIRLKPGCLHDRRPLSDVGLLDLTEFSGDVAVGRKPKEIKFCLDGGIGNRVDDGLVQARDSFWRRLGRREHAVPARADNVDPALLEGRHVGCERGALHARCRNDADLSRPCAVRQSRSPSTTPSEFDRRARSAIAGAVPL